MIINNTTYFIQKDRKTGRLQQNIFPVNAFSSWELDDINIDLQNLYHECRRKKKNESKISYLLNKLKTAYSKKLEENPTTNFEDNCKNEDSKSEVIQSVEEFSFAKRQRIKDIMQNIINFFSEFSFEPNFRFINTFSNKCLEGQLEALNYVTNYFKLTDNQYLDSICEKMKSLEFSQITEDLINEVVIGHKEPINQRFALYYGSAGTGKTTKAMDESEGRCMICHSAMLPSDLMEDFKFVDGHPVFTPSVLQMAMTNGQTIVLDEINLLPFESLRFLQSILDNKQEFIYKGQTIKIKNGFKVIGTMNLSINGCVYSIPEPLVDRACDLQEFKLRAEDLVNAI